MHRNFRKVPFPQDTNSFLFKQTTMPTVFVSLELSEKFDFKTFVKVKKEFFESIAPRYVHPSEFGFKLPTNNVPEFAFIGRSNVGKSSLISRILHNTKIIRISKEPGCTQSLNYYALESVTTHGPKAYFIDLPGYGFAKVSRAEQDRWNEMIRGYLQSRSQTVLK